MNLVEQTFMDAKIRGRWKGAEGYKNKREIGDRRRGVAT